jgi:hypothetical protein
MFHDARIQEHKNCTKSHLVEQLLTMFHDERIQEHKNCTKSHLVGQLLTPKEGSSETLHDTSVTELIWSWKPASSNLYRKNASF